MGKLEDYATLFVDDNTLPIFLSYVNSTKSGSVILVERKIKGESYYRVSNRNIYIRKNYFEELLFRGIIWANHSVYGRNEGIRIRLTKDGKGLLENLLQ